MSRDGSPAGGRAQATCRVAETARVVGELCEQCGEADGEDGKSVERREVNDREATICGACARRVERAKPDWAGKPVAEAEPKEGVQTDR
jgi:hypothetical protein